MADIGIQTNSVSINVNPDVRPVQGGNADSAAKTARPDAAEEKKRVDLALENVVSVSEDGDTVQATDESMERLEEDAFGKVVAQGNEENRNTVTEQDISTENDAAGQVREDAAVRENREGADNKAKEPVEKEKPETVRAEDNPTRRRLDEENDPNRIDPTKERLKEANDPNKPDPVKERLKAQLKREQREEERENIDTTRDNTADKQVSSYNGYTNAQLEQLYIKGEISKNDYDREMDARKERAEEIQEGNKEFSREMEVRIAAEELSERQGQEMKAVYSSDSSDTLTPETRDDIITKLQDFSLNN